MLPEFLNKFPGYEKIGLRDLCDQIHGVYKANDVARVTTEMYLSNMVPAMKPADAWARMAHGEIDRIDIDQLEGRITSVLLTPYPPGIPLLIPGERFNATIMGYLQFARNFNRQFPGFETDIHGLVVEKIERADEVFTSTACASEKRDPWLPCPGERHTPSISALPAAPALRISRGRAPRRPLIHEHDFAPARARAATAAAGPRALRCPSSSTKRAPCGARRAR